MMNLANASIAILLALFPSTTAHSVRTARSIDSNFDAPPLQVANLVVYCFLLLATLVQLACAIPTLFRTRARLPSGGTVIALTILTIGYALGIALVVVSYTDTGSRGFDSLSYIRLQVTASLFFRWADPAIFAAVALVLRDRYLAVQAPSSAALIEFTSVASILIVIMVTLLAAELGIVGATFTERLHRVMSLPELINRISTSNNLFYAYVAFHVLATLFLVVIAILVKSRTKKDKITSTTLFIIVPLLVLHALARLIFSILQALLPLLDSFTIEVLDALDFSSTLVYGILHLFAMTALVVLVVFTRLWDAKPLPEPRQSPGVQMQRQLPVKDETIQDPTHSSPAAQA